MKLSKHLDFAFFCKKSPNGATCIGTNTVS